MRSGASLMFASRVFVGCAALLVPVASAMAAPDGDKGTAIPSVQQGLATGIVALVVFVISAAFLGAFVWPKISKALEARENKIRSEIESAQLAREQARDALEQYEKNLAEARAEAKRMLDEAKGEQQALAAELRAKADTELNLLRERAMRDIEAAKRAAVNELYAESAGLASHMAAKILRREVSTDDQRRLVDESLRELDLVRSN